MKLLPTTAAILASASPCLAALCTANGLLGLGATSSSYSGPFYLRARSSDNTVRTITTSTPDSTGSLPLTLGSVITQIGSSNVPKFTLSSNHALTQNLTLVTQASDSGLAPQQLYLASSGEGVVAEVQAVNVSCDGIARTVLRFTDSKLGALGSGSVNGTYETGAGVVTPVLSGLLSEFFECFDVK